MKDCLKDLSKTAQKVSLNAKEGTVKKGGWAPLTPVVTQPASLRQGSQGLKDISKSSLLEPLICTYLVELT